MRAVIFDIDGTLADCRHRLHHITGPKKDYDAFFAAMGDDAVYEPIADLLGDYPGVDTTWRRALFWRRQAGARFIFAVLVYAIVAVTWNKAEARWHTLAVNAFASDGGGHVAIHSNVINHKFIRIFDDPIYIQNSLMIAGLVDHIGRRQKGNCAGIGLGADDIRSGALTRKIMKIEVDWKRRGCEQYIQILKFYFSERSAAVAQDGAKPKSSTFCGLVNIAEFGKALHRDGSSTLYLHYFGLLGVDPVLYKTNKNESETYAGADNYLYNTSHNIKGGAIAILIVLLVDGCAGGLMWWGYLQQAPHREIALYLLGVIVALAAPATAILVGHRLVSGNWGLLFSMSFVHPMFSHGPGIGP